MQRKIIYFLTLTALVLALSACGSSNDKGNDSASNSSPAAEEASQEIVIKASNWKFDQAEYALPKDTPVKLSLVNESGVHGIEIVGQGIKIKGNKSEVVTLPAGTYEFRCNIQCGTGHNKMVGKLVVS